MLAGTCTSFTLACCTSRRLTRERKKGPGNYCGFSTSSRWSRLPSRASFSAWSLRAPFSARSTMAGAAWPSLPHRSRFRCSRWHTASLRSQFVHIKTPILSRSGARHRSAAAAPPSSSASSSTSAGASRRLVASPLPLARGGGSGWRRWRRSGSCAGS